MKRWVAVSVVLVVAVAVALPGLLISRAPSPLLLPSAAESTPPSFSSRSTQAVPLPSGHYLATFSETGLPNGTEWGVLFNGTLFLNGFTFSFNGTFVFTPTPFISFEVVNGSYPFRPFCSCGPQSYSINTTAASPLRIEGASTTIQTTFQLGPISSCVPPNGCALPQPPYPVRFVASGLPGGTPWGVSFDNATVFANGTSLSYLMWNGTYRYALEAPGWQPRPASGNVIVNGAGVNQSVTFTRVTYPVTFEETGLPKRTNWWTVQLNGARGTSNTTTLAFDEPNGTYSWGGLGAPALVWSFPGAGSVEVNGSAAWITVGFVPVLTYSCPSGGCGSLPPPPFGLVEFVESGLPNGAEWSATINGTTLLSTVRTLVVFEKSGEYSYGLAAPGADPIQGSVTVAQSWLTQAVPIPAHFIRPRSPNYYPVEFSKELLGFPVAAQSYPWQVTIDGATALSLGLPVIVWEPNGTYAWSVVSGVIPFLPSMIPLQSGTVQVHGHSVFVPIATYSPGNQSLLTWGLLAPVLILGGVTTIALVRLGRKDSQMRGPPRKAEQTPSLFR